MARGGVCLSSRGATAARILAAALALVAVGAAAGFGVRAYQKWRVQEEFEAQRRLAKQAERKLSAAGIALRGAISALYRHETDSALSLLKEAEAHDPNNGYTRYLRAIALAEDGRPQEVPAALSEATQWDWTDYSHTLGIPSRAEMQRERDLLRRGGDDLCAALSSAGPPAAFEALGNLRTAGLRLAALRPASTLHLQRGAQLRVSASEAAVQVARQARDESADRWWSGRNRLDRDWAEQVRGEARSFIAGLVGTREFDQDAWASRLRAEEQLVATLCDQAPE